jgi:hypothetical protein
MLCPTLIAAVSDAAHPAMRAGARCGYRFWRDIGYAVGALASGVIADIFAFEAAILAIAALTFVSGVVVAALMRYPLAMTVGEGFGMAPRPSRLHEPDRSQPMVRRRQPGGGTACLLRNPRSARDPLSARCRVDRLGDVRPLRQNLGNRGLRRAGCRHGVGLASATPVLVRQSIAYGSV